MHTLILGNYVFYKASCFVIQNVSSIIFPIATNLHLGVPPYFTPNCCTTTTHLVPLSPVICNIFLYLLLPKIPPSSYHITSLLKFLYWILISNQIGLNTNTF